MQDLDVRLSIIEHCRKMNATGLNQGTSGNISVRVENRMLITPTSIPYDRLEPEMIATFDLEGERSAYHGPNKPSVEWPFHRDIMAARPEVNAIVHTHAMYSTILAIARRAIPACHYMVAAFGGNDVRVSAYARYGTQELSNAVMKALEDRTACLMANHGMIAVGKSLENAMWRAVELETIAKQYYHTLLIGGPVILPDQEIDGVVAAFSGYGQQ